MKKIIIFMMLIMSVFIAGNAQKRDFSKWTDDEGWMNRNFTLTGTVNHYWYEKWNGKSFQPANGELGKEISASENWTITVTYYRIWLKDPSQTIELHNYSWKVRVRPENNNRLECRCTCYIITDIGTKNWFTLDFVEPDFGVTNVTLIKKGCWRKDYSLSNARIY